jgi:hypothetical protein
MVDGQMSSQQAPAPPRLDAALERLAVTFHGMVARPDESNCECHWGSEHELAQLKAPDTELDPDLLRRTWQATDWRDHAAVLRRILPQLARALVAGHIEPMSGIDEVGQSMVRGRWQTWPDAQASAVREFLEAWWTHSLTQAAPAVPAHKLLPLMVEASARLDPWLRAWEVVGHPAADLQLAEAVVHWSDHLLEGVLPWTTYETEEEQTRAELTAWLVRHAPEPLRARLLGL